MEILDQTSKIRDRIAKILSPSSGRRVVIVAFIGGDALDFISSPQGVEIYCWPNAVATNPDGIRALYNKRAQIYFVDRLHMKAYWSEKRGYLIGSPNLSANALDETEKGLHELACYDSESSGFDVDRVIRRLRAAGAVKVDEQVLNDFERRYKPASKNATVSNKTARVPTFDEYLGLAAPKRFGFVGWTVRSDFTNTELLEASDEIERRTGRRVSATVSNVYDSIHVKAGTRKDTWLLAFRIRADGLMGKLEWLFPHAIAKPRKNAVDRSALQLKGLHVPDVPFDVSTGAFSERFRAFLESHFDELADAEDTFNIKDFLKSEARRKM